MSADERPIEQSPAEEPTVANPAAASTTAAAPADAAPPSAEITEPAPPADAPTAAVYSTPRGGREPPSSATVADARPGTPAVAGARGDLTADALGSLLHATFADGRAHYWTSHLDNLGPITAGLPTDLAAWSEGRVWDAHSEVRWQPDGPARFSALCLADGDTLPDGFRPLAGDLRAVPGAEAEAWSPWGTRGADGQYREPRLPHPLDYAGLDSQRPEVRLPCRLLIGADGQVRWSVSPPRRLWHERYAASRLGPCAQALRLTRRRLATVVLPAARPLFTQGHDRQTTGALTGRLEGQLTV